MNKGTFYFLFSQKYEEIKKDKVDKMKIKFKMISFCLAAILILTLAGQCFAAQTPFTDLTDISAKDKILALQQKGYVNGVADGVFEPLRTITAAEGIAMIVNAFDLNIDTIRFFKEPKATDYFKKANDNAWYAQTLIIASFNGLDLPPDLDPEQKWTREEFTYHLIAAMETKENLPMIKLIPVEIADEDQINSAYSGAIQRAIYYGIVELNSEKMFNPKVEISRAEAAEEIYNAIEYLNAHRSPKPTE